MTTLREWFDGFAVATGETPSHVVFGPGDAWPWDDDPWPAVPGLLVEWGDVSDAVLDREFRSHFGMCESPNLCAWSESWVIVSDDYDGAESLLWVPRHPMAHRPIRPGGGGHVNDDD
jgi:hypothetical protein